MLLRFSLYGFLKNQRYIEPVFLLALLDKGLNFGLIGVLFAFRELIVLLLEIPSGAIADVLGRRFSLVGATAAYIASFALFALSTTTPTLFLAMALYAVGEAFRSGTHKALIFRWLELENRTHEKTKIYGKTRSWSKYGSALAVIITGTLLATGASYSFIFAAAIVPYALLMINLLTYPPTLETPTTPQQHPAADREAIQTQRQRTRLHKVWTQTLTTTRDSIRRPALRHLVLSSMAFEGLFHATKDYLQPILAAIAITHITTSAINDQLALALILTPVYATLYILAGVSSRLSHHLAARLGGKRRAMKKLWLAYALCFATFLLPWPVAMSAAFVAMHVLQNLWRPMLISRFDDEGEEARGATILSVESQAKHLATMLLAPVVGYAVEIVSKDGRVDVWPIGVIGGLVVFLGLIAAHGFTQTFASDH